jgi:hypothetical protein
VLCSDLVAELAHGYEARLEALQSEHTRDLAELREKAASADPPDVKPDAVKRAEAGRCNSVADVVVDGVPRMAWCRKAFGHVDLHVFEPAEWAAR